MPDKPEQPQLSRTDRRPGAIQGAIQGALGAVVHVYMRPSTSSARVQAPVDSPARTDASAVAPVAELAIEPVPSRTAANWKRAASHRSVPRLSRGARLLTVVVAMTAGGSLLLAIARTSERERVQERLTLGCLDVADCRALVHALEASQKGCWFSCSAEIEMVSRGRALFRDALERSAAREKALQDAAFERLRSDEREQERARAAAARAEARTQAERQHRHTLERLAAQAERLKARHQAEQLQELQYLRQLSAEQRARRLTSCHQRGTPCATLATRLLQAAASPRERESLMKAQERYATASRHSTLAPMPPQPPKSAGIDQGQPARTD